MKTLYLLRHAKADPQSTGNDFTRRLSTEGIKQGQELATYWKKKGYSVDFAMSSAAVRTEQTLNFLLDELGTSNILVSNNFYGIEEDEILKALRGLNESFNSILYVGHNPGVAFFAMRMAIKAPAAMTQGYLSGNLTVFQIDADNWKDLDWHMGDVTDYWSPQ